MEDEFATASIPTAVAPMLHADSANADNWCCVGEHRLHTTILLSTNEPFPVTGRIPRCSRNCFPPSNLSLPYCKLRFFWRVRTSQVSMFPPAGSHVDHLVYEAMLRQGVSRSHAFSHLQRPN